MGIRKNIPVVSVIRFDFPNTNLRATSPCWHEHKMKLRSHDGWRLPYNRNAADQRFSRNMYTPTSCARRTAARGRTAHEWPSHVMTHRRIPLKRKKMKGYVTYGLHCTDCHKTHKCSAVLCGFHLYRISPKSVKKYGQYGYEIIYALSKVWLSLSLYLRKYAC